MKKLLLLIICVLCFSCSEKYSPAIETVLKQAGDNRSELEKVLKHYGKKPVDSLKFRAAEFLIANMPDKYSVEYNVPFESLMAFLERMKGVESQRAVDRAYGSMEPVTREDVKYITGDYLIRNIELAFKVWEEQPWGKDVPFDVFCEEILPYRVANEPLENWREKVLASFAVLNSSFKDQPGITVVEACLQTNSQLPDFRLSTDIPDMNYSMFMTVRTGMCDEMTALALFTMRALGIPVSKDYTMKWIGQNVGHAWNSVYAGPGKRVSFMGTDANPERIDMFRSMPVCKVYRLTFAKQNSINADEADIPPSLRDRYMKDVTHEYFTPDTLFPGRGGCKAEIPLKYWPSKNTGYAYIAAKGQDTWNIAAWGEIGRETVNFGTAGKNIIYLPLYYADNILTPAHYPFMLDSDGSIRIFEPDTCNYRQFRATEIFPSSGYNFVSRMVNGVFEGANRSDFSDAKVLHTVIKMDGARFHSTKIRSSEPYRYVRYLSPAHGYGNVAEIVFYNDKGEKLGGAPFGSPCQNSMACDMAFDGDILTFYDAAEASGSYAGLDLGEPQTIAEIRYHPRIEDSFIYEGYMYDLFYWEGMDWQLFEQQTAADNSLDVRIPANGMYYLKNATTGKPGKWFTLDENGKQIWLKGY